MASKATSISYATDRVDEAYRLVRTVGLWRLDQPELCARVAAYRDHAFDHRVMEVLNGIVRYMTETHARIKPGETVEHGWTLLQFLKRTPSLLEAYEIADPFSNEPKPPVRPGIDRAIRLDREARDAVSRNHMLDGDFPYRGTTCITCVHFRSGPHRRLYIERSEANGPRDSGWAIACSSKHHETHDLTTEHLAHVAADRRFVVPYLALSAGTAVAFDDDGATVFPPGRNDGRRDPGDPYAFEIVDLAG